uniref:Amidase domain-containing protein n=1 Tax=Plectus sambesii TaxID=2011161 RepID=A0A914WW59_9BILA
MLKSLVRTLMSALYLWTRVYFFWVRLLFWLLNSLRPRGRLPKPNEPLILMSASEAARQLRRREITSVELIEAYIARIEEVNPYLNAVVVKNYEQALALARQADAQFEGFDIGDDGEVRGLEEKPYLGVPFTLKDCMEVQGLICTAGIINRRELRSESDATVVARMRAAGGIPLVITNVSEVCMWWESNNRIYGRTKNPYDSRRIVGGSSGGEAALIAAAGSVWGIGSDIGGSIRLPAFFNGLFGLKPTPGLVPDEGCIPYPHGYQKVMHTPGPICRYAEDLKPMLRILAGPTVTEYKLRLDEPVDFRRVKLFYMEGLRTPAAVSLDDDMRGALKKAVRFFETRYDLLGHRLDLPLAHYALQFFLSSIDNPDAPKFSEQMLNRQVSFILLSVQFW